MNLRKSGSLLAQPPLYRQIIASVGVILLLGATWLLYFPARVPGALGFAGLYGLQGVGFLIAAVYWPGIVSNTIQPRTVWPWVAVIFLALRIPAYKSAPFFENDHHRYLWDGKVAAAGINPYIYAPQDEELRDLRDSNWERISYKQVPTLYPPLAQRLFEGVARWGGKLWVWKALLSLAETGTLVFLFLLLRHLGRPSGQIIFYAWNPLVLKEVGNSAHVDGVLLFFLTAFLYMWWTRREKLSSVMLALAVLIKLTPAVWLPVLFWSRQYLLLGALFLLTLVLMYVPYYDDFSLLFRGLFTFGGHWEFNDSLFLLLKFALEGFHPLAPRVALGILVAGLIGYLHYRHPPGASPENLIRYTYWILGALLLFAPVANPWYFLWLTPFLALQPRAAWLVLCVTLGFSYLYYWQERDLWWVRFFVYSPFFTLLLAEWWWKGKLKISEGRAGNGPVASSEPD